MTIKFLIFKNFNRIQIKEIEGCESTSEFLTVGSDRAYVTSVSSHLFCLSTLTNNVSWSLLEEKVISDQIGFVFPADHFFLETFNQKIAQMFESGISKVIIDYAKKYSYREDVIVKSFNEKPEENSKTVLTLDHFAPWFYALFFLLLIATFVFIIEMIFGNVKK